jgi:hypothetical protein
MDVPSWCRPAWRTAQFAATITELRWSGSSGTLSEAKIPGVTRPDSLHMLKEFY